ncbi:MAG: (2Fe-2S)-binding protein [Acidimicrobiaceae bacterium]|nr:(2Fe-2S)-binding protein [Acidimicrobiaceae bacterium]
MMARLVRAAQDPIGPLAPTRITLTVDGEPVEGVLGQTLAGVMLSADTVAWRSTSFRDKPRGAFCGIGVCFDCLVVVNGQRDVRACQRRAAPGDVVEFHRDMPLSTPEERP